MGKEEDLVEENEVPKESGYGQVAVIAALLTLLLIGAVIGVTLTIYYYVSSESPTPIDFTMQVTVTTEGGHFHNDSDPQQGGRLTTMGESQTLLNSLLKCHQQL
jgi:hypothetical protein